MVTVSVATAVLIMAFKTVLTEKKDDINPTATHSPNVNNDNNCHFIGDLRLASSEPAMITQVIVDINNDNIGTVDIEFRYPYKKVNGRRKKE